MKKYAIIGTSCSGKTTLVYNITGQLRKEGYLIEGLTSTDRIYPFEQSKLDNSANAQAYVILQQIFLENRMSTRDDVKIILSDRSSIDFFAYMDYFISEKNDFFQTIKSFVFDWAKTYDKLFYVEPRPYVSDGKRPNDAFRLNVNKILLEYLPLLPNIIILKNTDNNEEIIQQIIRSECKISD